MPRMQSRAPRVQSYVASFATPQGGLSAVSGYYDSSAITPPCTPPSARKTPRHSRSPLSPFVNVMAAKENESNTPARAGKAPDVDRAARKYVGRLQRQLASALEVRRACAPVARHRVASCRHAIASPVSRAGDGARNGGRDGERARAPRPHPAAGGRPGHAPAPDRRGSPISHGGAGA